MLGIALLLVFGIGRVLGTSSDGSSEPGLAQQAAAQPTAPGSASTASAPGEKKKRKHRKRATVTPPPPPTTPALAPPSGPCANSDIVVTPEITKVEGGSPILISLELRTRVTEACTWTVSPETLALKITSGSDDIWSSRQCPASVPTREVVVRQALGTKVGVRWNGKRSDQTCSALTEWAVPGYYHVVAAALAGEPADVQFKLVKPAATIVTTTITPSPKPGGGKHKPKNPDASQPTDQPTGSPTGATEPG